MKNASWGFWTIAAFIGALAVQADVYASGKERGSDDRAVKKDFCITDPFTNELVNAKVVIKADQWRQAKRAVRRLSRSKYITKGECEASPSGGLVKVVVKFDHWDKWWHHRHSRWDGRRDSRRGDDPDRYSRDRDDGRGDFRFTDRRHFDGYRDRHSQRFISRELDRERTRRNRDEDRQFPELFGHVFPIIASLDPWRGRGGLHSIRSVRYDPDQNRLKVRGKIGGGRYWVLKARGIEGT